MYNRKRISGFTLIELLVVIAIIAVLAAILFPVFAAAREKARSTTCLNNERQILAALQMYVQDNSDTFMPAPSMGTVWSSALPGLGGKVFDCPSAIGPAGQSNPKYAINSALYSKKAGLVQNPASLAVLGDLNLKFGSNTYDFSGDPTAANTVNTATISTLFDPRHNNGVNIGTLDGSVRTVLLSSNNKNDKTTIVDRLLAMNIAVIAPIGSSPYKLDVTGGSTTTDGTLQLGEGFTSGTYHNWEGYANGAVKNNAYYDNDPATWGGRHPDVPPYVMRSGFYGLTPPLIPTKIRYQNYNVWQRLQPLRVMGRTWTGGTADTNWTTIYTTTAKSGDPAYTWYEVNIPCANAYADVAFVIGSDSNAGQAGQDPFIADICEMEIWGVPCR